MPFESKAQSRFAFATDQPWAKEFANKTNYKGLPERAGKKSAKRAPRKNNTRRRK
jgi:hypothetical protein